MAASQGQFQLFPTTQPQNRPNNPPRRHRRRSTKSPTVSPVLENAKASEQTEALILKIIEDTNSGIPSQANQHPATRSPVVRSGSSNSRQNWPSRSASLSSRSPDTQASTPPSSQSNDVSFLPTAAPSIYIPPASPLGLHFEEERKYDNDTNAGIRARSPSATSNIPDSKKSFDMTRSSLSSSLASGSPPVPMRSIFPRYDPNLPLNQQHYYPNDGRSPNIPPRAVSRSDYYKPGNAFSELAAHRPRSGKGPEVVSLEALEHLWSTTSGEDLDNNNVQVFHLRMKRIDSLTYTFGSDSLPFYTLNTNSMNDIELHKTHPSKENTKSPIVSLNLKTFEANNGSPVRISLFPKLAELQARSRSAELAKRDNLSPFQAMEAENDAVRRTEAQETCILEWQSGKTSYNLYYKALKPRDSDSISAPQKANEPSGILHASVSSPSRQAISYQPSILITIPEQATIGTRSPQPNYNEPPLVALDLESSTLSIFAGSLLPKIPSLYSIDTLVSAIITVALSNEPTRAAMSNMEIYEPKAEDFPDPYRSAPNSPRPSGGSFSRFTGPLVTTIAEREEAEQEATLMKQMRSQSSTERIKISWPWKKPRIEAQEIDLEANITTKTKRKEEGKNNNSNNNSSNNSSNLKDDNITKLPTVNSIDLGRYGDFSGENNSHARENLPKPTRAALNFLFWIFSLIVWALSRSVKFLAWLLVGTTRCFSSKKP